jgi:hypothetical protein
LLNGCRQIFHTGTIIAMQNVRGRYDLETIAPALTSSSSSSSLVCITCPVFLSSAFLSTLQANEAC